MRTHDWQTGIRAAMWDNRLPSTRSLYYRLPRRSGATTFLVEVANEAAASGRRVLFLVKDRGSTHLVKDKLSKNVDLKTSDFRGGYHYDMIIGDCLGSETVDQVSRMVDAAKGLRLFIDTID